VKSDSWMDKRLERLEALYQRFGREGLAECSDAFRLLWSKQMQLRDGFKGKLEPEELAEKHRLELEIKDLAQFVGGRQKETQQGRQVEQQRSRGMER
jgi:hypothetical protein